MSGTSIQIDSIKFSDNTKQYMGFPPIGGIIAWAGKWDDIPSGYLRCDGKAIDATMDNGIYENLYNKLGHNRYGVINGKRRIPDLCRRFPKGTGNWNNETNIYGGSSKLNASNYVHQHKLNRTGWVSEHYNNEVDDDQDQSDILVGTTATATRWAYGPKLSTGVNPSTGQATHQIKDADNKEFYPEFVATVYIIRYE